MVLTAGHLRLVDDYKRKEWHEERRKGIGGSDAAAVLGISPYRTPMEVWMEKTGRREPEFSPQAEERMRWGTLLEGVVADEYARRYRAVLCEVPETLWHPDYPHAYAHPDRVRVPGQETKIVWDGRKLHGADLLVEIKTTGEYSPHWGDPGTDEIPDPYLVQVQWYMGITGLQKAHVVVLFGGRKLDVYRVERDDEFIQTALETVEKWWERYVVGDVPPPPQTEAEAKLLWPRHRAGKTVEATTEIEETVRRLKEVKKLAKELEEEEAKLRNVLTAYIGEAEILASSDGTKLVTWKANKDRKVTDWKALAQACGADEELIAQYTQVKPGSRVLRIL
ncbi:putative phage-type endonuclease [Desulfacinum hydrothermale DSM 13146]|uniref:Putative phage-type endonuclease n=1 Tax=Desulfacinum hydrothermale DSM 13146 TaxID=1121390 RepID=A0A1W1XW36_9BACT|nr:YqaJ viral recombinase family protein [Desulfacinum hydrothermale]SMC28072.1 putative phage-type endonuclease [Desulfacinum hydrothermale DSM 13146]